jgi:hypothetical protein
VSTRTSVSPARPLILPAPVQFPLSRLCPARMAADQTEREIRGTGVFARASKRSRPQLHPLRHLFNSLPWPDHSPPSFSRSLGPCGLLPSSAPFASWFLICNTASLPPYFSVITHARTLALSAYPTLSLQRRPGRTRVRMPTHEHERRRTHVRARVHTHRDWGIANTTLEEAFIKISRGAVGT